MEKIKEDMQRFYASRVSMHTGLIISVLLINFLWWLTASKTIPLSYVAILISIHLSGIYGGRWLYHKYFLWTEIWSFIGYVLVLVVLMTLYGIILFSLVDQPYFVKYAIISFVNASPAALLGVFITLSRDTFQMQINDAKKAQQQKENELSLLHAQLSPHFLFNTLNNLYSMALVSDKRISPILLRLSDLLRYSLYETKNRYVPLSHEIEYISNYIELEKIRIGDRLVITCMIDQGESAGVTIAPMVLIVFLENAFKHSKNTYNEKIFIEFCLRVVGKKIRININNSYDEMVDRSAIAEDSGLGISNVTKRLELLYPDQHKLTYSSDGNNYNVELILESK